MGAPMLGALLRAGIEARGFDIRPRPDLPITQDPTNFGRDLDTLISVVRDADETDALLFGAQNLIARIPTLQRIIICSTLSPRYFLGLRDRIPAQIALIDAPMSGAEVKAKAGTLSFMLGGETGDLDACMPLFQTMGGHIHRMGPLGSGMQTKVLNNLLAASNTVMTRLVLDWADQAGLDEDAILQVIATSSGQNWLASGIDEIEFARAGYAPENSLGILKKDVGCALDAAPEGADQRLPQLLQAMVADLTPRPKG